MALKLQKYAFLELISEAEAMTRGVNLSDKVMHILFKTIRGLSTPENASRSMLYNLNVTIQEIASHTKKDVTNALRKLINDNVLTQLFRLDFDAEQNSLNVVPCFIALPQDDKLKPEMVFQELILHSVKSIEFYLASLPPVSREDIWRDLETDFADEKIPGLQELPALLSDIFASVEVRKFDVSPSPEMIKTTIHEIEEELVYRGKVANIIDYGLMPVRDRDYLLKLETAGDFILTKLIPKYKNTGNLKNEMGQIALEEANYFMDPFAQPTSKFIAKKAAALKKAVLASPARKNSGVRFPGSLAVESVLMLDKHSAPKYEEKQLSDNRKELEKWRQSIREISPAWQDNFHIISEMEFMDVTPFVRNQMMEDTDFIHGEWELPGESMHVFFLKEPSIVRQFARGMVSLPQSSKWQILMLKTLMDRNELYFKELFMDPVFLRDYGRMLRHAYAKYISFFYRLLDMLGIKLFQNQAYQNAKRKILMEQQTLSLRNKELFAERMKEREEEKLRRLDKIKEMEASLKIIEKLDEFYLAEKKIPTVEEVRNSLKLTDPISFRDLLSRDSFQTVPMGGDSSVDSSILVYPLNHEWRSRSGRLHRVIDSILDSFSGRELNPLEEIQLQRAKKMVKFLSRKEKPSLKKSDGEDPYDRLEKEIQKQKKSRIEDSGEDELEI